jgi:hypothetical protein
MIVAGHGVRVGGSVSAPLPNGESGFAAAIWRRSNHDRTIFMETGRRASAHRTDGHFYPAILFRTGDAVKRKDQKAFERDLEKRFEKHLADLQSAKLEGKRVTAFCYPPPLSRLSKHWLPIRKHLRQLFFELQNASGPFFDRDGRELTFEVWDSGTLIVWRHPRQSRDENAAKDSDQEAIAQIHVRTS